MARTKDMYKHLSPKKRNELAAIAQAMDQFLRRRNEKVETLLEEQQTEIHQLLEQGLQKDREMDEMREELITEARRLIIQRDERIEALEANFEAMAQTLHDALEDLEKYRMINNKLTEQVLDCTCKENQ